MDYIIRKAKRLYWRSREEIPMLAARWREQPFHLRVLTFLSRVRRRKIRLDGIVVRSVGVITVDDLPDALKSPAPFALKFDMRAHPGALDQVDAVLGIRQGPTQAVPQRWVSEGGAF